MKALVAIPGVKIAARARSGPPGPPQRILVVDDDEFFRFVSTRTLRAFGYQVDTAEDGSAGWEALQSRTHDLLLTDHNMPRMSGIELVKKVRIARMMLPAVMVSGALPTAELERHPWLGIAVTLAKPFSPQELLDAVKAALNSPPPDHQPAGVPVSIPIADKRESARPTTWGINE